MKDYQKISDSLVEKALKLGASAAQVSISDGTRFSVDVREGEVEQLASAGSTNLSLKVFVGNKSATAGSSDLSIATLERLTSSAIERAKLLSDDEFSKLPDNETLNVDIDSLKLYDAASEAVEPKKKIALAIELEKIALKGANIKRSTGASFSNYVGSFYLSNSNGFSKSYKRSSASLGVGLQAGDDDNLYEDGYWDSARAISNLLNIEKIANEAIKRTSRMIGARKIKTQNVPIVLEPEMTAEVMLGFLVECLSGSNIYMNRSFLTGKIGNKIASDLLNIYDDPFIPAGIGSVPFDGEGVAARKNNIISNGVLESYFLSNYSARKLKMKPTGPAPTNLIMKNGSSSPDEIIKSVDKGLLLCSTIGQGTVATSGDISKGAYGIWIEKGELTYPVSEVTISGNLSKMMNEIEMIGNDPDTRSSIIAPTVKIKEMTISGK